MFPLLSPSFSHTKCETIPRQGFQLGQYCCRCKEGYYSQPAVTGDQCMSFFWLLQYMSKCRTIFKPQQNNQMFCWCFKSYSGLIVWFCVGETVDHGSSSTQGCYPVIPVCVPCWPGCKQCQDGSPCWIQEDWHLRAGLLTVHGFFMALVLISMLRVYQCRRTRVSIHS